MDSSLLNAQGSAHQKQLYREKLHDQSLAKINAYFMKGEASPQVSITA